MLREVPVALSGLCGLLVPVAASFLAAAEVLAAGLLVVELLVAVSLAVVPDQFEFASAF
ncbi:hypothetical protein [Haloferax elongans]|uniref:hypothetical protein n=1 Tax=Haloferax elongans TaxID=403191 RepID=UPI00135F12C6|nr:hypothetical protein [Haloferax elongans]